MGWLRIATLLLAATTTDAALAGIEDDVRKCAALEASVARLECYDALGGSLVREETEAREAALGAVNPDDTGNWEVFTRISKKDDSTNVFVSSESREPHIGRFGAREHLQMWIACRENTTSLWITFADEFMSDIDGGDRVLYRIDKDPAKRLRFRVSNDNMALGLWSGGTSIPFIKEIASGSSLFVEAVPFSENAVSGEFDLHGLSAALAPLREACHW